jgi:AcrR family transcriptional regulator
VAKRAYATEDKAARRRVILTAAAELFSRSKELPSVAEVAAASGLAKGTVYLYFRTKGAIFADILLEGWGAVIDQLGAAFRPAEQSQAAKVAAFLNAFVRYLDDNPTLLRLDAIVQGLLEGDLDADERAAFKATLHHHIHAGGAVLDEALGLAPGQGVQLLVRTHALTRGLWTYFDAPGAEAAFGLSDFAKDLAQALTEYWRGALGPPADTTHHSPATLDQKP